RPHRLTYDRLCKNDDILTDVLVDHVLYWTTVRKACKSYHPLDLTHNDVISILSDNVILQRDFPRAMSQILELPGLRQYSESLRSPNEVKDFLHHMRKYLDIYLPDCPFEISSTYRYSASNPENSSLKPEASIVARKHIKCGEEIKYLCGISVPLHKEELALLSKDGRDFSIVESSRKKTVSLMLAPARFVNHTCDPNARLDLKGSAGAMITAIKNIEPGHEITVFYADDYF
ncbi:hypothetical protein DL98DRAFT_384261, partial [Cadophora sp. DSE1049]